MLGQRSTEQSLRLGQGEGESRDGVVLVLGRRDVPAELELRPVVGTATDPQGATHPGLELAEVHLPDLVGCRWRDHERRLKRLRVVTAVGPGR